MAVFVKSSRCFNVFYFFRSMLSHLGIQTLVIRHALARAKMSDKEWDIWDREDLVQMSEGGRSAAELHVNTTSV